MAILKYILLFFFYSAAGWAVESLYRSIGERKLLNSGFLVGPMCPIYGTGATVMTLLLFNPFYDKPLLVFLFGMIVCDIVEYITSLLMELLFNQHWWNYQYEFINIRGRICLKHTLYWGAAATGFTYLVHPGVNSVIQKFSDKTIIILLICVLAVFLADCIYSFHKALDVRALQTKYYQFKKKIGEPINEIIGTISDSAHSIGDKLDESNEKLNESRNELFDQAQALISSFEDKLGVKKGKNSKTQIFNRLYTNKNISKNSRRALEWLKHFRDTIKSATSDSDKK